jgi:catechol 2,3-dioxygenase
VDEVGDDYRVGGPEDWTWPAGRNDHWGIATRDVERMRSAERALAWT